MIAAMKGEPVSTIQKRFRRVMERLAPRFKGWARPRKDHR